MNMTCNTYCYFGPKTGRIVKLLAMHAIETEQPFTQDMKPNIYIYIYIYMSQGRPPPMVGQRTALAHIYTYIYMHTYNSSANPPRSLHVLNSRSGFLACMFSSQRNICWCCSFFCHELFLFSMIHFGIEIFLGGCRIHRLCWLLIDSTTWTLQHVFLAPAWNMSLRFAMQHMSCMLGAIHMRQSAPP